MEHTPFGRHGGASRARKLASLLVARTRAMRRFARGRGFDLALAHGSNDLALAARGARGSRPSTCSTTSSRRSSTTSAAGSARRVMTPDAIPPERLRRYGVGPEKLVQYPGLKEEYYLADFEPDRGRARRSSASTADASLVVVRPPPDVSLYHRKSNPLFPQVLDHLGTRRRTSRPSCCRAPTQQRRVRAVRSSCRRWSSPSSAVDAQSLVALADLVVSAGGTMNREAVALGTPVYTTYGGRLGGVDEALIRERPAAAADRPARRSSSSSATAPATRDAPRSRSCSST